MENTEIINALNSVAPRKYQNKAFGRVFLGMGIVTVAMSIILFFLAGESDADRFNIFRIISCVMLAITLSVFLIGIFFVIMNQRYITISKSIFNYGKKFNATILEVFGKNSAQKCQSAERSFAIRYSFTGDNELIEGTTKYLFKQSEIEYYKTLNYFPILFNKEKNQYLYFVHISKKQISSLKKRMGR